jgi:hypothetical protein
MEVADIVSVVWVDAGAAKAAEVNAVTAARARKVFAQKLAIEEYTEEQGELWDVSVMGSLFGSLLRPETLVLTVTSTQRPTYCTKVAPWESFDWPLFRYQHVGFREPDMRASAGDLGTADAFSF